MNLTFDQIWKIDAIVVLIAGMYYQVQTNKADVAELKTEIGRIHTDQQWLERHIALKEGAN